MRIGFYAGRCIPIHARSLEERPLGGTETGVIRVSEILQQRGHDVVVFTALRNPPPAAPDLRAPTYVYHEQLFSYGAFDAVVFVQDFKPMFFGAPFKRSFFWTGDGAEQFANFGLGDLRVMERLEALLVVSRWHAETLCAASGFPLERAVVVGNGVHLPYFEGEEARNPLRLIYASAPYRGLELLPAIFLELKKKHPRLELHVFAGMKLYDREQPFAGPELQIEQRVNAILQKLPDCQVHGTVTQRQLAREFMKSAILTYPNTIFETCCIVALESQAAACPVIASATSALPETVGDSGFVIAGEPGSPAYMTDFIRATDRLLSDHALWQSFSARAYKRAQTELGWGRVADRFEQLL